MPRGREIELMSMALAQNHRRVLEESGARYPVNLTPEDIARAGANWHIFPNTILLPSVDCVLWYRLRPHPGDAFDADHRA